MKFSDLTECPICGCEEFYTNEWVTGPATFYQRFDGKETDNTELYGYVNHRPGARAYYVNCEAYLGNVLKDEVSKKIEKGRE